MQHHQLFQVRAACEPEGARAEAANRSCCHLQHMDACAVDTHLRVYRSVEESERAYRGAGCFDDCLLYGFGLARWCYVNRLFEKRAIERIRLVENRENLEFTTGHEAF